MRRQGTGKPDEIERLMSGLERGHRKSTIKLKRQLADVLLYHENWLEAHRYLNMDYLRELKKEALRKAA
jgi:hypothetical protein